MLIRPPVQTWTLKSTLILLPESALGELVDPVVAQGTGSKDWGVMSATVQAVPFSSKALQPGNSLRWEN